MLLEQGIQTFAETRRGGLRRTSPSSRTSCVRDTLNGSLGVSGQCGKYAPCSAVPCCSSLAPVLLRTNGRTPTAAGFVLTLKKSSPLYRKTGERHIRRL